MRKTRKSAENILGPEWFMNRAISLAKKAREGTWPNPMVGSLVVKSGQIVGEGYHKKEGTKHAEVIAL